MSAALLLAGPAQAANRALLVGVGKYQSVNPLSGIDIDINTLRQWAPLLGFTDIEVLQNEQATYANVRAALQKLVSGMNSGDRALFYFSGHGGQFKDDNGDESDQKDEALILYDSTWKGEKAENVLLDDEIGSLLSPMNNGELLMLVDACNSGTVDKSVSNRGLAPLEASDYAPATTGEVKGLGYIPIPAKATAAAERDPNRRDPPASARYVAVTAAQDDQFARASANGSYFTLGLAEALRSAKSPPSITPTELRDQTATFITANVKPKENQYTPQLQGNPELFAKRLSLVASDTGSPHGEVWAQFEELLKEYGDSGMTLGTDQGATIKIGKFYTLELQLPKDLGGYLSVVAVDSGSEEATVLFPNTWASTETEFKAGDTVKLPPSDTAPWGLKALPPASKTLIVALVTPEPLELYEKGIRKSRVTNQKVFARLSPAGFWATKAVRSTGAEARAAAAKVIVDFQP
jgi:hypothetical protein